MGESEEREDEEEEEEEDEEEEVLEGDEDEEEEEEEEEVYEVLVKGKKVYTTDEKNGVIYEILPDDDIGKEIGKFKNGKPLLY